MLTAIVVPADLEQPLRLEQLDKHDLNAYRDLVGGNIEVINLYQPPASLYINEDGKDAELPPNPRATALLWVHNSAFRGRDTIAGDAFILGPPEGRGDDTSAPVDLVDLLLHTRHYRVQVQMEHSDRWSVDQIAVLPDWYEAYLHGLQLMQWWTIVEDVRVVPELDEELREQWYRLGMENPWIRLAEDPPFTRHSFVGCFSLEELEERIGQGNWSLGTAFYYRDLCLINQINGGDEWMAIRYGMPFESITFAPSIERGEFASLVTRLLAASRGQCQRLEY